MNKVSATVVAILAVAMSSCGGAGSGSGASSPIAVVPAPAPSPSPTSTPTPTPTPSVNYDPLTFTSDRSFVASGLRSVHKNGEPNAVTLDDESVLIGLDFFAADRRYRATYRGEMVDIVTQALPIANFGYEVDSATAGDNFFARYQSAPELRYVSLVRWTTATNTQSIERLLLFGAKTQPISWPTSGSRTYHGRSNLVLDDTRGSGNAGDSGGPFGISPAPTFTVDWAARTFTATIPFHPVVSVANQPPIADFTLQANGIIRESSSNQVSGTIQGNGFSGRFIGNVFGPEGIEAGMLLYLTDGTGRSVSGTVVGRQ
jgi:hypothetical protein